MIRNILMITTLFIVSISFGQNVKMKKDVIYLDGAEFLSYEKKMNGTEFMVYELNSDNELFTAIFYSGTSSATTDNYYKIVFNQEDKTIEYTRPYWNKSLIKWLIEQKVLEEDGSINSGNLDKFINKYDENVQERTIRIED